MIFLAALIEESVKGTVDKRSNCVCASNNGAKFNQEDAETVSVRFYFYKKSSNLVVEVEGGHVVHLESIVVVCILIGLGIPEDPVTVDGWNDV